MPWLCLVWLASEPPLTLDDYLSAARRQNHTLRAAAEQVRQAEAERREAGLPPNPRLAWELDGLETPGRALHRLFWEQELLTGGKLARRVDAAHQSVLRAEAEDQMQRRRVEHGVRLRFHRLLAAQEAVALADELAGLSAAIVAEAAPADQPAARLEAAEARLDAATARRRQRQAALELAAACGNPALESRSAAGSLPLDLPALEEYTLTVGLFESPEQKAMWGRFEEARRRRVLARAEAAPEVTVRLGVGYDDRRRAGGGPMGWTGSLAVMLPLPIHDRNQHEQAAWQAATDAAAADAYRRDQALLARFSATWEEYLDAGERLTAYHGELLPAAQAALAAARDAGAGYLTVLNAQRTLARLRQRELAERLRGWEAVIQLQAAFLTDPLAALGPN